MAFKGSQYLYQNGNGIWIFQVFVPTYMRHISKGRRAIRKSTGTRDIEKARNFRDHMIIEWNKLKSQLKPSSEVTNIQRAIASLHELTGINEGRITQSKNNSQLILIPKLVSLCDEYLYSYQERRSQSTLSKAARAVTVFLSTIDKIDISLDRLGRKIVNDFAEEQKKKNVSSQTIQNWLSCLSSLYEFAKRRYDNIPPLNPFQGHNLEAKRTICSYEPFESHQIETLLLEADDEIRDVILIALYSGMRLDEICSLKIIDIVIIEDIKCFNITKGKNKSAIRYVPIHSYLKQIIDKYTSYNNGIYLFTQANNIKRKDGKHGPWYSQKFAILKKNVLPAANERQCFHSIRGMFITCLDRAQVPEQRIAEIVGHTKGKTESRRTYSLGASLSELSYHVELVKY
ncbi:tyrosine-type recombinase/integrase [Yersinia mollaretii]|uniref:tyrosine-type recombinase/integrase n=1 Tax=Yersinia mollaretii TaxID=33060 RepID=UPI0011A3507E|nr:tyrosine-type recombinase/integrase [Yersinia mollaretii]